jgi:protein-L-isoaspartate(D-aspartate) O-methyltransferase
MKDTYRHKGMRRRLVEELAIKGITDKAVLEVMNTIPRHFFLDNAFEEMAYQDKAFAIGEDQTISQPYTVAFQTQLLEVQKRDKILEIGTGSGYQASVLAMLGARVFTIERIKVLHLKAKNIFEILQLKGIRSYFKDGYKGLAEFSPFDKIIITAAAPEIPPRLIEQLKVGGYMIIPYGNQGEGQKMMRLTKLSEEGDLQEEVFGNFRFVPMLKGKQ